MDRKQIFKGTLWKAFQREELLHRATLILIFLSGFGLRLSFLFQPMKLDEAASYIMFASHNLSYSVSFYPSFNNHLFNSLLMHFSTTFFGNAEWAVRLPVFLCGVLVIPGTYIVIRRLLGKYPGLLASALVAFSPILISYSTEARGYSIQTLIFLVLVWTALEIKEKGFNIGKAIAFCLLSSLGFYTIPTFLYAWSALVLWLILSAFFSDVSMPKWKFIGFLASACAGAVAITVLLYLPVVNRMGIKVLTGGEWLKPLPWSKFLKELPGSIRGVWYSWTTGLPIVVGILLALGLLISIIFYKRICSHRVNLILVVIIWSSVIIFIQRLNPFARVWLPLFPLYLGFASAGLIYGVKQIPVILKLKDNKRFTSYNLKPEIVVIVIVVLFSVFVLANQSAYQIGDTGDPLAVPGVDEVLVNVQRYMKSDDLVCVAAWSAPIYQYYFERLGLPLSQFTPSQNFNDPIPEIKNPKRYIVITSKQESKSTKSLAWYIAGQRGLDLDHVLVEGTMDVGDYHIEFVESGRQ